jgi:hypothetical protein
MKNLSKTIGKALVLPALALVMMTVPSCKKEQLAPSASSAQEMTRTQKHQKLRTNIVRVLKDFTVSTAGGSSTTTSSGGGSSSWSSTSTPVTTYSTPSANVYQWSDPTTGTTYTLSESTGGSGLGQLSFDGKSFDYNYVLSIKSEDEDPNWDGFFDGRDLRGCVAIDGELTDSDFELNSMAFFFVATEGGSGTYEFIDFEATTIGEADALGSIIDLSSIDGATLSGLGEQGNIYYTSGGHIAVTESSFEMQSDAKVTKLTTNVEYTLEGSIMFE